MPGRIAASCAANRCERLFATPNRISARTMMLVQTCCSPTRAMPCAARPSGWRIRSDKMFVSSRKLGIKDRLFWRRIFDFRKLFVDRLKRCQDLKQRFFRRGLDHQARAFLPHDRFVPGQLEFAWDADGLVTSIPEQFDVSLRGHF